jgi:hypothetical protein
MGRWRPVSAPVPAGEDAGPWVPPSGGGGKVVVTASAPVPKAETAERAGPWMPPEPVTALRLVLAVDATASRAGAWGAAKALTDDMLGALPGKLEAALAVHGGSKVKTFTRFTSNPGKLRDMAAGIECESGTTRLLEILEQVLAMRRVGWVVYIGDAFEEDEAKARKIADKLLAKGTRVIILHDGPPLDVFASITERTGGALLPFEAAALSRMGELFAAVAVVAVGGTEALKARQATMPAATLLLEHLDPKRLLIGSGNKI